ncbi:glycosyl transferase [Hydrogenimonas sp.]
MSRDFIPFLKCVGTGARHNRDLSVEEMRQAAAMMLTRRATDAQIAAFLLGWRLKPETAEELAATLEVLDDLTTHTPVPNSLELGYPFDGKADNPYLFHLAAEMVAPFGLRPVVYAGRLQPSKGGLTVAEALEAVAAPPNLRAFRRRDYCPALADLTPIRRQLGLRTAFNTLERLPGVSRSDTAVIGVFHKPFVARYAEIFGPRYRRLVILKGNEGTPEIFSHTRYWVCEGGRIEEGRIDPADFSIEDIRAMRPTPKEAKLAAMRDPSDALMRLARLNAAFWLFAKGMAQSVEEGWERIR